MIRIISLAAVLVLCLCGFPSALIAAEAPAGPSDIVIDSTNFPDDAFRQFILDQGYDRDSDLKLSVSELAAVTDMNCEGTQNSDPGIRDLTGIEHFSHLTRLNCRGNMLQELDTSDLPDLVYLDCSFNRLTSLEVSSNTALETLFCSNNSLTYLKVSGCYSLRSLECEENELSSLDISNCHQLDYLSCQSNGLTRLDVTTTPLIRNYILTTPRVDNGTIVAYGEFAASGADIGAEQITTLYHVEMDSATAPYSNDTGRSLDTGMNADPFLITTIIFAYMLTGHFARRQKERLVRRMKNPLPDRTWPDDPFLKKVKLRQRS